MAKCRLWYRGLWPSWRSQADTGQYLQKVPEHFHLELTDHLPTGALLCCNSTTNLRKKDYWRRLCLCKHTGVICRHVRPADVDITARSCRSFRWSGASYFSKIQVYWEHALKWLWLTHTDKAARAEAAEPFNLCNHYQVIKSLFDFPFLILRLLVFSFSLNDTTNLPFLRVDLAMSPSLLHFLLRQPWAVPWIPASHDTPWSSTWFPCFSYDQHQATCLAKLQDASYVHGPFGCCARISNAANTMRWETLATETCEVGEEQTRGGQKREDDQEAERCVWAFLVLLNIKLIARSLKLTGMIMQFGKLAPLWYLLSN